MRRVNVPSLRYDPHNRMGMEFLVKQLNIALREIQTASAEERFTIVAADFTVSNYTETRTLDASTATAGDIADFLCTFIADMQKGGKDRYE